MRITHEEILGIQAVIVKMKEEEEKLIVTHKSE